MSLKQLNKSSLIEIAHDLQISDEGTKPIIEERISEHFDNHPELEGSDRYKKFFLFKKRNSPKKSTQSSIIYPSENLQPLSERLKSSPDKVISIKRTVKSKSSPFKGPEDDVEDVDDSEDDSDEEESGEEDTEEGEREEEEKEEEEEENDTDAVLSKDSELLDDAEDGEYKPKLQFVTDIQDWLISKYENFYDSTLNTKDELIFNTQKTNSSIKKSLSSTSSVNFSSAFLELGLIFYKFSPLIHIKDANFLNQEIVSKYKFINTKWKIVDLESLIQLKFLSLIFTWFSFSVLLPLIASYYFNFISKKFKKTKYDPFVFNIGKLLFTYILLKNDITFDDVQNDAAVWAGEHGLIETTTCAQKFQAHLFHNAISLSIILGNVPVIGASIGALIALYVAAI